ncbi:unnamed protein product [Heligmosomoides polygyrus]|uniref:Reverse transcriptase domain-containing protein n=1 Tax=Heligmosomoides polygyrus TaxID=6339 RepID=A0A183F6U1_HELPZ|nr:unnamed protein product [Heligmosomoides polygyrus]
MKKKDADAVARIRLPTVTTVEETWRRATDSMLQAARSELGVTKPGRRKIEKQTWLCGLATVPPTHCPVQKIAVEETEAALKKMQPGKTTGPDDIAAELCNSSPPTHCPVQKIAVEETEAALKKMQPGKTTGPDDIAAELCNSRCWNPAKLLTKFFNQVVAEKKIPGSWQQSTTIPIWKKKGSPADCTSYRPIRLLSHGMKIFERIVGGRIRVIVWLFTNEYFFVAGCGTIDAIHAVRLLVERHREKQKPLHLAFLDLEKAFDRVPHEVIWYGLGLCYTPAGASAERPRTNGARGGGRGEARRLAR